MSKWVMRATALCGVLAVSAACSSDDASGGNSNLTSVPDSPVAGGNMPAPTAITPTPSTPVQPSLPTPTPTPSPVPGPMVTPVPTPTTPSEMLDAGMDVVPSSMNTDAGDPMDMMNLGNGSALTGTLGALGPVAPVLAGFATTNGLETLIYLSSAPLTCAQMMTMGAPWLRSLPAGSQVIEIVVRGMASVGTVPVGFLQGEINYAEGSKSSSNEVNARSGSITFTRADAKGVHEGMLSATYPTGGLSGTFHAEWCEGGQEY